MHSNRLEAFASPSTILFSSFFFLFLNSHHHKKSRKYVANGDSSKARKFSINEEQDEGSDQIILQLEEPLQEFVQDDLASEKYFSVSVN